MAESVNSFAQVVQNGKGAGVIDEKRAVFTAGRIKWPKGMDKSNYVILVCEAFREIKPGQYEEMIESLCTAVTDIDLAEEIVSFDRPNADQSMFTMSFQTEEVAEIVISQQLQFKGKKIFVFPANLSRIITVYVHGVYAHAEVEPVKAELLRYGEIRDFSRLPHTGSTFMQQFLSHRIKVIIELKPGLKAEDIPQVLLIEEASYHVLVPGTVQRCYKCNLPGHIEKNCNIPICTECKKVHRSTEKCFNIDSEKHFPNVAEQNNRKKDKKKRKINEGNNTESEANGVKYMIVETQTNSSEIEEDTDTDEKMTDLQGNNKLEEPKEKEKPKTWLEWAEENEEPMHSSLKSVKIGPEMFDVIKNLEQDAVLTYNERVVLNEIVNMQNNIRVKGWRVVSGLNMTISCENGKPKFTNCSDGTVWVGERPPKSVMYG